MNLADVQDGAHVWVQAYKPNGTGFRLCKIQVRSDPAWGMVWVEPGILAPESRGRITLNRVWDDAEIAEARAKFARAALERRAEANRLRRMRKIASLHMLRARDAGVDAQSVTYTGKVVCALTVRQLARLLGD